MCGSISGEHGIGMSKAAYLPLEVGPAALAAMKHIKQALDPNNILNPGKIFMERQEILNFKHKLLNNIENTNSKQFNIKI
jgi:hypothetical protein